MATRAQGQPRTCAVGSCGTPIGAALLMCPYHWRQAPKPVRHAVSAAWRAWNASHSDEDWDTYIDARTAALTAVED